MIFNRPIGTDLFAKSGTKFSWSAILFIVLFAGCYTKLDHPSVLSDGHFDQPRQDTSCMECHSQNPSDFDPNFSWWMAYDSDLSHPVGFVERPWWRPSSDGVSSRWGYGEGENESDSSEDQGYSSSDEPPVYQGHTTRRHTDSSAKESAGEGGSNDDDDDKPAIEEKKKKTVKKKRKDSDEKSSSEKEEAPKNESEDAKSPGSAL